MHRALCTSHISSYCFTQVPLVLLQTGFALKLTDSESKEYQTSFTHWQEDSHNAAHVPVFCVNSLVNNRMTCLQQKTVFNTIFIFPMKYYKMITSSSKRLHTSSEADLSGLDVTYWNILRKGHGSGGRASVGVKSRQQMMISGALEHTYIRVSRV